MMRCGVLDVYIKLECVCIFYNVYEVSNYEYFFCLYGEELDVVM